MNDKTEITLRALVDGRKLKRVRLPDAIELAGRDAALIAAWARPFCGMALSDDDIHVGDIKPSYGLKVLSDLDQGLAERIRPLFKAAEIYGFGLRLARETMLEPYRLDIVRRVIDPKQLTIPARSMRHFLNALSLVRDDGNVADDQRFNTEAFATILGKRHRESMDAGVAHYHSYAMLIVAFARANGATELVWGRERRGSVAP